MKIEPILYWLVGLMVFFSLMTLFVASHMSSDGQTFQVMSGCLLTVLGYFGGLIKRAHRAACSAAAGWDDQYGYG